jgi:hypothetical protein
MSAGRWLSVTALGGMLLLAASCNVRQRTDEAKKAVNLFHERLDSEDYAPILAAEDQIFRRRTSDDEFRAILSAVHRKLGTVTKSNLTSWRVNANTNGTFVTLVYGTAFRDGDATETFGWRVSGGKCQLVSYNISSNALITK